MWCILQKAFSKKTVYKTSLSPKNILQENGHLPGPETSINQLHSATLHFFSKHSLKGLKSEPPKGLISGGAQGRCKSYIDVPSSFSLRKPVTVAVLHIDHCHCSMNSTFAFPPPLFGLSLLVPPCTYVVHANWSAGFSASRAFRPSCEPDQGCELRAATSSRPGPIGWMTTQSQGLGTSSLPAVTSLEGSDWTCSLSIPSLRTGRRRQSLQGGSVFDMYAPHHSWDLFYCWVFLAAIPPAVCWLNDKHRWTRHRRLGRCLSFLSIVPVTLSWAVVANPDGVWASPKRDVPAQAFQFAFPLGCKICWVKL